MVMKVLLLRLRAQFLSLLSKLMGSSSVDRFDFRDFLSIYITDDSHGDRYCHNHHGDNNGNDYACSERHI